MPQTVLAPPEYWSEVQLLSTEIEDAAIISTRTRRSTVWHSKTKVILKSLNNNALFWQTQMHCLQASLFVTLSRIFDIEVNAHTIHTLINATRGNLHLFSVAALRSRKTHNGPKPDWLDSYMAEAWIPTSPKDLRHLKTALAPHTKRFEKVYRPIRHAIFAHRLNEQRPGRRPVFWRHQSC